MTINGEEIKSFTVCGKEQGELVDLHNLEECYKYIQDAKRFDKEEGIEDIYIIKCNTDTASYGYYRIYKRNNRYGLKYIEEW